jgi:hypothetical protein
MFRNARMRNKFFSICRYVGFGRWLLGFSLFDYSRQRKNIYRNRCFIVDNN